MTETSEVLPNSSLSADPGLLGSTQASVPSRVVEPGHCLHCGLPNPYPDSPFCCAGCEAINATLNKLGLQEFYRYRDIRPFDGRQVSLPSSSSYAEFDSEEAAEQLGVSAVGNLYSATLQLSGIHCAGCLWLLERISQIEPAIVESRLIFGEGRLVLTYDAEKIKLSQIASKLNSLGYPPESPLATASNSSARNRSDRKLLIRIGVAGFSAMNTMMMAVSLFQGIYTGIDPEYGTLFRLTSLAVATPAVLFSAWPFYTAAYSGLKFRRIHIDLPISIAVIGVYLLSAYNALRGNEAVYFDSICTLIFLLLSGRYIQSRALARAQSESRSAWSILPLTARVRRAEGQETEVPTRTIKPGEDVVVLAGERLPVDGEITEGETSLDLSVITGESRPIAAACGETVSAGSLNLERRIVVRAAKSGSSSRLAGLIARLDRMRGSRPEIVTLTDRRSSWFVGLVLVISAIAFVCWLSVSLQQAIEVVVAFLLVTCPCALGLAAPTVLSLAVGRAAKQGILIKTESALERASLANRFFFDKTGTLTRGKFSVEEIYCSDPVGLNRYFSALGELAAILPRHPVSAALLEYLRAAGRLEVAGALAGERGIHGGRGVSFENLGRIYRLGSASWHRALGAFSPAGATDLIARADAAGCSTVLFSIDGTIEAAFMLRDSVTDRARNLVSMLSKKGIEVTILSGDSQAAVNAAASALGLPAESAFGALLPEDKAEIVAKAAGRRVFVGDGVNDAPAMQAADLAISLHGAIESTLEVADIVVPSGDVGKVGQILLGSNRAIAAIQTALKISACYNIVAGGVALCGLINPFIAAIIMPFSSGSVVALALFWPTFVQEEEV